MKVSVHNSKDGARLGWVTMDPIDWTNYLAFAGSGEGHTRPGNYGIRGSIVEGVDSVFLVGKGEKL